MLDELAVHAEVGTRAPEAPPVADGPRPATVGSRRRRLRVTTLIDTISAGGGGETLAFEITRRLDPERFEPTICATRMAADESCLEALRKAGVNVLRLDRAKRTSFHAWLPLIRQLRQTDVLHAHKFGSNVWGVIFGHLTHVPVVLAHEHTWSYEGQPMRRILDRELIARWSSMFLMVSREDQRRAHSVEGIDPGRMRLMPHGVPTLRPSGRSVRAELGITAGAPVVGAVAGLRSQKALDVLIRAAAELAPSYPDLHVLIAGRGPEQERLEALVSELGLERTVQFLGRRDDVADVVASFDVAALSSDFEGSPLSVMEYMSAGKAIVATSVGGVPDLIDHDVHGLLVDRGDHHGLATAIGDLLADPVKRADLGRRARERHSREFHIDAAVRRFESLYEELYRDAAPGRRSSPRST
jgi:glycosyltransferase involved in cell wall biosynthesis